MLTKNQKQDQTQQGDDHQAVHHHQKADQEEHSAGLPAFMGGITQEHDSPDSGDEQRDSTLPVFMKSRLPVGAADDPLEREADHVAKHLNDDIHPGKTRSDPPSIQRQSSINVDLLPDVPPVVHDTVSSSGQPLKDTVRGQFEKKFGADFSGVRIHKGGSAGKAAASINARAFTSGSDIVFGQGEYNPGTPDGQELLAHELTHVIQQQGRSKRVNRSPGDDQPDPLAQYPTAASNTKAYFSSAFMDVYTEAINGKIEFGTRASDACAVYGPTIGADKDQTGAIRDAAQELSQLQDGFTLGTEWKQYDLAQAVNALYQLLPSDINAFETTSFGFEYVFNRLIQHSADFVALSLQEYSLQSVIDADPTIYVEDSGTAFINVAQDLSRIVAALEDGKSLLMLELEGTISQMVTLREQFDPSGSRADQEANALGRSQLARRAVLLNDQLLDRVDAGTIDMKTPLDETVKDTVGNIRETARSEEDTRKALGDSKSLLAAQPLNLAKRVDDPYFAESGLADEEEALKVTPQSAFPEASEKFMSETQNELAERIKRQGSALQDKLDEMIPPKDERQYDLEEFAKVYRHWFSLFSVADEKRRLLSDPMSGLKMWHDYHKSTAWGTTMVQGDIALAYTRHMFMEMALDMLGWHVSGSLDREFSKVITDQKLKRKSTLKGSGAGNTSYEFAELYGKEKAKTLGGEESSRANLLTNRSKDTATQFSDAAKTSSVLGPKKPTGGDEDYMPPRRGAPSIAGLPVYGLRTVEAQNGWSYLTEVYKLDEKTLEPRLVGYEHKVATPEVAAYLLAYRQHTNTLSRPHSRTVDVADPSRDNYTVRPALIGDVPSFEAGQSRMATSFHRAYSAAGARTGISKPYDRPIPGIDQLEARLLGYLNAFFEQEDFTLKLAAIFHIMNMEHNVGAVLEKMFEPAEIAKVVAKAFAMGAGLGALSRLGPIGQLLSMGIGKAMKVQGGSDLTAALTVAAFIDKAMGVSSFGGARMVSYIGEPIIQDIKQLFEAAISAGPAALGSKVGTVSVDAIQAKIARKPPETVGQAAEIARQLPPEARDAILAEADVQIADLKAQGVGSTHSSREYDMLIAFRNSIRQQSTMDQLLGPDTRLTMKAPDSDTPRFIDPDFKLRTEAERAKLQEGMGDLAGKVPLIEDPTLKGGEVRVYYEGKKVRMHVGKEATKADVEVHMGVVRTLRKYEGIKGSIRLMLNRVASLMGIAEEGLVGTRGWEARQELTKLGAIRDKLLAQQAQIDKNSGDLVNKLVDDAHIEQHIKDIESQMVEHLRDVNSLETGKGYIAAKKKSKGALEAEKLGFQQSDLPEGHHWQLRDSTLSLVTKDQSKSAFYLNQDILREELAKIKRGDPGDVRRAIRPASENVSAGESKARTLGIEHTPAGHHWREDSTGNLVLVRQDNDAPHFWFDAEAYQAAKTDGKVKSWRLYIRPIAEKADSNSDSARFEAATWVDAYRELGGDGDSSSFGKFTNVLNDLGVGQAAVIEQMKTTPGGGTRGESPQGTGVRTIRHATKQHFIDNTILPHINNVEELRDTPLYSRLVDAGKTPQEALRAASHARLLEISRRLDSADIGSLGERWFAHWEGNQGDKTQFSVSKADAASRLGVDIGQDRNLDTLRSVGEDKAEIFEIKNVGTAFGKREQGELDAHLALLDKDLDVDGTVRTVQRVTWAILNPDALTVGSNVAMMHRALAANPRLRFQIYDSQGNMTIIDRSNYRSQLPKLVQAARTAKTRRAAAATP